MSSKVILIDDDDELRDLLEMALEDAGYDVEALDSTIFTKQLEDLHADVIVVDVWFKNSNSGVPFIQALNRESSLEDIPAIMISSDPRVEEFAHLAHADAWMQKPIDIFELIQLLDTMTSSMTN